MASYNRTFPRQNQEEHIAGVTDVRISNSFIALNEEITVEDETRNTHPSTGISRKDMERVNGNEQHTITKTCEPETTKEWITKAFATQGKETKKHKDNNESKESAKGGISEEENAIADHDGLAREDRLVQLSKDKENEDHIVEFEMVVYNATLESDGRDLQGMLDQIAPARENRDKKSSDNEHMNGEEGKEKAIVLAQDIEPTVMQGREMVNATYQVPFQMIAEEDCPSCHDPYQITTIYVSRSAPMEALHVVVSHQDGQH